MIHMTQPSRVSAGTHKKGFPVIMDEERFQTLKERYALALERIREIESEQTVPEIFRDYFRKAAGFILLMDRIRRQLEEGESRSWSLEEWQSANLAMYEDILPEHYGHSYANPVYAVSVLGKEYGRMLSFLYVQIRGMIGYVFDGFFEETVIHPELLIEVYNAFEQEELPKEKEIRDILYWFVSDYCDVLAARRVRQNVDPELDLAERIIMDSDLEDLRYLYRFGEYITGNELETARYLNSMSEEEIGKMAETFTEGYRLGFVHARKDLSKKSTVNIRYHLGFERMIREAVRRFAAMGLRPVIFRCAQSSVNRRGTVRSGYEGADPNPQYDYDHREDAALFLDRKFMQRRLDVVRTTYEAYRKQANGHAGPAVLEVFGEEPFIPENHEEAFSFSEKQKKLQTQMSNALMELTNRYIIGEERSFTIMAFPLPSIGPDFAGIFADTVRINTLDNRKYEKIQQALIDALDSGRRVHILGMGGNRTDLTVSLHPLKDPEHETDFENCLADVNIPVGEVFTSPQLEGTNGVLHVTGVYLDGLYYKDLSLTFRDGMITDYSCSNFESMEENRAYVRANVLFHHSTLPMGEFAIGTNTAAYVMAEKYGIGAKMPILIAEKCGPHFAVGDTCYSWEEDNPVYNPDGKEVIARDNSISLLRREDPLKAYFGCHTDITIPYSQLGRIRVLGENGYCRDLLENGRFVLPGTEELNEEFLDNGYVEK